MTHPTREQLERWRDTGSANDRDAVVGHLAACEPCRRQYVELVRFSPAAASPRFDPQQFVARGRAAYAGANAQPWRWRALWIGLPTAAAAALAVALLVPRQPPLQDAPIEVRGSEVQGLAPAGDIASLTEFRWSSPYAASRYRLTVRDAAGATVLTSETGAQWLPVSAEWAPRFRHGRYSWTVEALDASGRVIAASRPRSFALSR